MAKELALNNGMVTMVDDEDYEYLSVHRWHAFQCRKTWYVIRSCSRKERPRRSIYMHRVILGVPAGTLVDHKDGNGLNNTRSNLRVASGTQNQCNRDKQKDNTSGYKGVTRKDGRWAAQIKYKKTCYHLGAFDDPVDAAKAYDAKARELHGEFAKVNFD